jgi:ubiquinone/menaquinone biosynthesis C-methylase UbiE
MNCDRIARWYSTLEYLTFGSALLACRCHQLAHCLSANRVLMLGEGDGRFLHRFLMANPHAHVDYVDRSRGMMARARQRLTEAQRERVCFHAADSREFLPGSGYDTVVSHFFLDCLTASEVAELALGLKRAMSPGSQWIVSEFEVPAHGWQRLRARLWIAGLYRAFHWLTGLQVAAMPAYADALQRAGFRLQSAHNTSGGLLTSQRWKRVS